MDSITLEEIRREANEVLHAVGVLEGFMAKKRAGAHDANGVAVSPAPVVAHAAKQRKQRKASVRDEVYAVIRGKWLTSAEIAQATGLDRKQVGGVVNGPRYKHQIEKRHEPSGVRSYRLKEGV